MAAIDANLDDVQAGAEASSRAADTLIADTGKSHRMCGIEVIPPLYRLHAVDDCSSIDRTVFRSHRSVNVPSCPDLRTCESVNVSRMCRQMDGSTPDNRAA
jgi:hypothetical protein